MIQIYQTTKVIEYFDPSKGSFIATETIEYPVGSLFFMEDENCHLVFGTDLDSIIYVNEQDLMEFFDYIKNGTLEKITI